MIKIWLDDERDPAGFSNKTGWTWVRTAPECIALLIVHAGNVEYLSLDHDLGDEVPGAGTGHDVANWIEEQAHVGSKLYVPADINVHSANAVGAKNMQAAIDSAFRAVNLR